MFDNKLSCQNDEKKLVNLDKKKRTESVVTKKSVSKYRNNMLDVPPWTQFDRNRRV